jgi:hypothetical protein
MVLADYGSTIINPSKKQKAMSKRKYAYFIFHTGEDEFEQTESWQRVFTRYNRNESAAIYGMPNYDGAQLEIIMSK